MHEETRVGPVGEIDYFAFTDGRLSYIPEENELCELDPAHNPNMLDFDAGDTGEFSYRAQTIVDGGILALVNTKPHSGSFGPGCAY
ncbi:MAG TPA: hypothetical protein VMX75_13875, partial [Spirochaetia bacterium]|nr:hypothetical protein [Spirochaetia bacterium]